MIAVLLLALGQFTAALLTITVFLFVVRQFGVVFYQYSRTDIIMFALTAFAVTGAVWGVFVRPWWLYLIASSLLALLLLQLTISLVDALAAGTNARLGPEALAFLWPVIVFVLTYPLGGIVQWLIGLAKR